MDYYPTSLQHILAELARLDLLIQVQVWRARQRHDPTNADLPAFYIPEAEVDGLLEKTIGEPTWTATPLPPAMQTSVQAQLDAMAAAIAQQTTASLQQGVYLRLVVLAHLFELTTFDLDVLLICLAPELDRRYERLYAYLHDDVTRRQPTVDLVLNLLCPDLELRVALRKRFDASTPLLQHRLLYLVDDPSQHSSSFLAKNIQLDPRIARYLLDSNEVDARLLPYLRPLLVDVSLADLALPPDFKERLVQLSQQGAEGADLLFYFQGPYGVGKRATAIALCRPLEINLFYVDGARLLQLSESDFETLIRLTCREALLQGAALYWDGFDQLLSDEQNVRRAMMLRTLDAHPFLIFLAGDTPWEPADALHSMDFVRIVFPQPDYEQRCHLWATALDETARSGLDLAAVAGKFRLSGGQIQDAAATAASLARWRTPEAPRITDADLHAACRLQSNRKLAELAQKITPHYGWDDLVLPADQLAQLREIYQQVQQRGLVYDVWGFDRKLAMSKGLNVLFAGPPGTGKTMAADVLAQALALDLYKIDLSSVVSKYIGETEKNLARIFAEARSSNALLFFDEADALFGKRTAVKDAHDRHANVEIAYLLQKMEEYEGVVILATNLRKNLDDAFVRRLHFTIDFPLPNVEDRRRIWSQIWPEAAPRAPDLDLDYLAQRIELAGGNIRNIALAGAFLAAADGGVVTMQHLFQATRREYQKMGKALSGREFGEYR